MCFNMFYFNRNRLNSRRIRTGVSVALLITQIRLSIDGGPQNFSLFFCQMVNCFESRQRACLIITHYNPIAIAS